jgi:hypothetical protein
MELGQRRHSLRHHEDERKSAQRSTVMTMIVSVLCLCHLLRSSVCRCTVVWAPQNLVGPHVPSSTRGVDRPSIRSKLACHAHTAHTIAPDHSQPPFAHLTRCVAVESDDGATSARLKPDQDECKSGVEWV